MSIDSIGGRGSRESAYEAKRKQLEQDRARELAKIEERYQDQVAHTQELRDRELESIYEGMESATEEERERADERIQRAKEAADDRIRSFEEDSRRMTEEARRQFQAKADSLARAGAELENQRDAMLRQHNDTMKRLQENREDSARTNAARIARETDRMYQSHLRSREELEQRAASELEGLERDYQDKRHQTVAEGENKLARAQASKQEEINATRREVEQFKRDGRQQLEYAKAQLESQRSRQQGEFDHRMHEMTRQTQREINRAQLSGRQDVQKAREVYDQQIDEIRKSFEKKNTDTKNAAILEQNHIENEAKLQDKIALENIRSRRKRLTEEGRTLLEGHSDRNERLREKLNQDFRKRANAISEEHRKKLDAQAALYQAEIAEHSGRASEQLDAIINRKATTVAAHGDRQSDPFYRLHRIDGTLSEYSSEYVLEISVPEHEQDTLRVTHQPGSLTISGTRRSETKTNDDSGVKSATNTFQSYSETYPISGSPVMAKLTRSYDNGVLTFRIPRA